MFAVAADSYIKDTTDFIVRLSELAVPTDFILVSFDIGNLYSLIEHDKGVDAQLYLVSKTKV